MEGGFCLLELRFVLKEAAYDGRLALFRHHHGDFFGLFRQFLVDSVHFSVKADRLERVLRFHTHVDVELSDHDVRRLQLSFIFKLLFGSSIVCRWIFNI